jgi:hypothetical protein
MKYNGDDGWITWELFEERYGLPARDYPERCDFDNYMIYNRLP